MSLILVLKQFILIHISVSFSFYVLLLDLVVELGFCHRIYPASKSCLSILNSQWMRTLTNQRDKLHIFVHANFIWLSTDTILLFFCPWSYNAKRPDIYHHFVNIFSIAVHAFRNLFWKICPLFGQILVPRLNCSRTSFSSSFYNEKMPWCRRCCCKKTWIDCYLINDLLYFEAK